MSNPSKPWIFELTILIVCILSYKRKKSPFLHRNGMNVQGKDLRGKLFRVTSDVGLLFFDSLGRPGSFAAAMDGERVEDRSDSNEIATPT